MITTRWRIALGDEKPERFKVLRFTIEKDFDQPDMAVIVVRNDSHRSQEGYSNSILGKVEVGDACKLELRDRDKTGDEPWSTLFRGVIVGLEPKFSAEADGTELVIRAFHQVHKLLRGKHTQTYPDKTDKAIWQEVLTDLGPTKLVVGDVGADISYRHVHQQNQSKLDFARERLRRLGAHFWVRPNADYTEDELVISRPKLDEDTYGIKLKLVSGSKDGPSKANRDRRVLQSFAPKLNQSPELKSLEVRGWHPVEAKLISAKVEPPPSQLGKDAAGKTKRASEVETFVVDMPIESKEEAQAIAEGKMLDYQMRYITADAETLGALEYCPGIVVTIDLNRNDDRFNGKYLVTGTTHRLAPGADDEGFTTTLRLARNAERSPDAGREEQEL